MKIVNIIATDDLGRPVNLEKLARREGVEYDNTIYPGAYVKIKGMKGKITVYRNGKIIVVGNTTFKNIRKDIELAKKFIFSNL